MCDPTEGQDRRVHLRRYLLSHVNAKHIKRPLLPNIPPRVLIGGPPVCWTWVMMLEAPPAAAIT